MKDQQTNTIRNRIRLIILIISTIFIFSFGFMIGQNNKDELAPQDLEEGLKVEVI